MPDLHNYAPRDLALAAAVADPATRARFTDKVVKPAGENDPCWPWAAGVNTNGYGQFLAGARYFPAPRVAYVLDSGLPIPDGLHVVHVCGCSPCCNPSHLRLDTSVDQAGVLVTPEAMPWSMSDPDIMDLRLRYAGGETVYRALALDHVADWRTIRAAIHGLGWIWEHTVNGVAPVPRPCREVHTHAHAA